jgi:REP element-mobilizing transposase RayT
MARTLRLEFEGALYHLCARGNRRERIFADQKDWQRFVALLKESLGRYQVEIHAYVLLPNHFHLLARTPRANLSRWMHWLLGAYSIWFNRRHRKSGHLFQGRYKSFLVEEGNYLLGLSRYLHLNPVRGSGARRGRPQRAAQTAAGLSLEQLSRLRRFGQARGFCERGIGPGRIGRKKPEASEAALSAFCGRRFVARN